MKGVHTWSFSPYKPFLFDTGDIYVCRLYPGEGKIGLDWLPLDDRSQGLNSGHVK